MISGFSACVSGEPRGIAKEGSAPDGEDDEID